MKPIPLKYRILPLITATFIGVWYYRNKKDGTTAFLIFGVMYFVSYFIISAAWRDAQTTPLGEGKRSAGVDDGCPAPTIDVALNLKNRQKAIDEFGYGPPNPVLPNREFWERKNKMWKVNDDAEVKSMRCGNCAAFDISAKAKACIGQGIGGQDPEQVIDAGELGYCRFLKFKCAAKRTCDAWVTGGPIK